MLENHQLRYNARQQLGGGIFQSAWLNMLLVCLIISAITSIAASTGIGVVAVLLFVLNFSVISNTVRRTVTSPASYYRYVEKKNTTKVLPEASSIVMLV